ncbi:MAG: hypothetical protein K6T87_06600 [Roseiflexus sp.]|uniref:hypothetical protein n=1 Tax=Roseiflexus sp. TaxID=2562120 RepID=UPI0025DA4587|nr:hypothetical protein [Roseiflexus sp.]MCL6540244.1 hypothetical protein [Roseiflexus sp.]
MRCCGEALAHNPHAAVSHCTVAGNGRQLEEQYRYAIISELWSFFVRYTDLSLIAATLQLATPHAAIP